MQSISVTTNAATDKTETPGREDSKDQGQRPPTPDPSDGIELLRPTAADGAAVHALVAQCPPLDTNSMYCNLLQCSHFAGTSVAARMNGQLVGFVSGYLVPERTDTLFVWQVAVSESARGHGLATRMLSHLLDRLECQGVNWLETSITASNRGSWGLFEGLAAKRGTDISKSELFDRKDHFNDEHDTEHLVRIGPFRNSAP